MLEVLSPLAIPISALIISAASLLYTAITGHHKAEWEYVDRLEVRMTRVERDLRECEEGRKADARDRMVMHEENARLMRLTLNPPPPIHSEDCAPKEPLC